MSSAEPVCQPSSRQPAVSAAHSAGTAPVARLLDALTAHSALLVVRSETPVALEWLTVERIQGAVAQSLMGPTGVEVWAAAPDTHIVALRFSGDAAGPMRSLEVHSLCQFFARLLSDQWRAEFDDEPGFTALPVTPLSHLDNLQENIAELNSLLEILLNRQLAPQFQPIVSLRDGRVFGYETLIRGPKGALIRRPGQMFRVADKARVVAWFDLACMEECLKAASGHQLRHLLFLNMDAEGLSAMAMQERPIALRVREHGFTPSEIVIEITERQMACEFPKLMEEIKQLRDHGFRIAIDDAGAGYSSLRAVSEIRPDFVKIDRDLVKNIDVAGERRALLAALAQYARSAGTSVVAEGAETREELAALIDLGIPYCQGYALGKPADTFRGTPREVREFVQERVKVRELRRVGSDIAVGSIARPGLLIPSETPLSDAARRFAKEAGLTSIAVLQDGNVAGLLLRQQFDHALALVKAAQAAEMMPAETVGRWMRTDVLRVDSGAPVREVVEQVLTRNDLALDADILVLNESGEYHGVLSVRGLMEAASSQPAQRALYADPLTGLPGRVPLERELRARIEAHAPLAVIRVDLSHLGAVNEQCGLTRGDDLILAVAGLIATASSESGRADDFIGHLGGDDFVVLTHPDRAASICQSIVAGFEKIAPLGTGGAARPGPESTGAAGGGACYIFAAAVTNRARRWQQPGQPMSALYDLMRSLKAQPGSRFAIDGTPGR